MSPKILESHINTLSLNNNPLINTDSSFIDQENVRNPLINKFDKKNKNYTKVEDIIDVKKNKNKLSKKNRKTIDLNNSQRLINSNTAILNEDGLNLEIIKTPKLKKKNKLKNIDTNNNIKSGIGETNIILINKPLSIEELSIKLKIPAPEIITYLFLKGISVTINQVVDLEIIKEVASKYNVQISNYQETKTEIVNFNRNSNLLNQKYNRPPIITIFGHVDHGKTTLLDSILKTNLVSQEYGGITQSITGYEIDWLYNQSLCKLVFVDTPGHDSFVSMRSRGAQITDIALLVVAADDGLQPQTIESINHILSRNLPYIVIINKIDKNNTNTLKIKEELALYNIMDKHWGGDAIILEVSALHNKNIDILLSAICEMSIAQNLQADMSKLAVGIILETYLSKNKGIVANVVVKNGILKLGDYIVAGTRYCKVKNLFNYANQSIKQASPSSIVQVLGFSDMPIAGTFFENFTIEKDAKIKVSANTNMGKQEIFDNSLNLLNRRVTLDICENNSKVKQLNLILKTDTQGSVEAILHAFSQISQDKVQLNVLIASSGNISNNDCDLAHASNALILGFNINIRPNIIQRIKKFKIEVNTFNIIYDLLDYIKDEMMSLIEPEFEKVFIGRAIVQTVFNINKGIVAGCLVNQGKLTKNAHLNIYRDKILVSTCKLDSLKRMKEDVLEVNVDIECGVMSNTYNLWKDNDTIEAYQLSEKPKSL